MHKEYLENNTPFSILLLDLDNFKSVHEVITGHHIGDEVIKHVGTVLNNIKHQKYPTMEPCRYGGDRIFSYSYQLIKKMGQFQLREILKMPLIMLFYMLVLIMIS